MMKSNAFLLAALALLISAAPVQAQQTPATSPTTASAEVMQCAQAQMVVDRLLSAAITRAEAARQSNSAADMRAAVEDLQVTLRDVRAQLAPCANVQPAPDPHIGHPMPSAAAPAPGAPAIKPGATAPPAATSKPAAADPHAGHDTAPAAPAAAKPATAPTTQPAAAAKPAATDPHAGHTMPPATPTPATKKATPPEPKPSPPPPKPHSATTTSTSRSTDRDA